MFEPILELENIDQSWKKVVVDYSVQFWNLGPLFTMVTFNNDLTLSIEEPRFKNNAGRKFILPILERRKIRGPNEVV